MRLISILLHDSPRTVLLALLAGVVSGIANAGILALINTALNREHVDVAPPLIWAFAVLCLLVPVTRGFSAHLLAKLGQDTVMRLRLQLSRKILAAPLRQLEEMGPHRLLVALTQDVASIVTAISILPLLAVESAVVAGCLIYLGWLSWTVLLAVLFALALGIVSYRIPIMWGAQHQREAREYADHLYEHFGAVTAGTKELKLHRRRRSALLGELEATSSALRQATVRYVTFFSTAAGWGQLVIFGMIGTLIFFLPGWEQVDSTTVTGYALILLYMSTPLESILNALSAFSQSAISFRKIESLGLSLGAEVPAAADRPGREATASAVWSLSLEGVTHGYKREGDDAPFTLGPIDLKLTPGEVVFLIGGNGSGKTTLAKVITGLYAPEAGEVRLNGEPVTESNRDDLMQQFSVVFSDFYLFQSLLGLEGEGIDELAARYLAQLQLDRKVTVVGAQLSTTALSQGQRKRLALLTAYLEDRPIYLFDEWAADQDPVFKQVFYLQLLPELRARGKAVIVISHDDHFYGVADRIVKLEAGRLEYDGPPVGLRYTIDGVPVPSLHELQGEVASSS